MKTTDVIRQVYFEGLDLDLASVKSGIPKTEIKRQVDELKDLYASDVA